MKEVDLQNSIVTYLEYTGMLYTCTLGGIFLGKSNWKQKSILKKQYKKGVPDILIFEPSNNDKYNGLMIELKVKGNYPTKEQKEWIVKLNARNYKAMVCRSLDEFIEIINAYKNETI
tara:strand:- start:3 stop:353 length:351 start_codon:yes stop_codon:yes gene_type:complete